MDEYIKTENMIAITIPGIALLLNISKFDFFNLFFL